MEVLYSLVFFIVGLVVGAILLYMRAYLRYENKEKIDRCYKERTELKKENESLKSKVEELEEEIKNLEESLEKAKREIMEKNKYLSEDKVVIERLAEVKKLADKIAEILMEYDKNFIREFLEKYKRGEFSEKSNDWKKIKENKTKSW